MSIEALLVKLIDALDRNTAAHGQTVVEKEVAHAEPIPFEVPMLTTPAAAVPPVVDQAAPPPFIPVPPVAAVDEVFTSADLMKYVGAKFAALGAEKGMMIMDVLQEFGATNINGLTPDQYTLFRDRLEAATA
jgi:hypothetical protein